jgi:3-hydroxyacyl-CoA dehydrogenase/enoyl-CoA hydratase/3-hydroxybutyryl-CoA epimerase
MTKTVLFWLENEGGSPPEFTVHQIPGPIPGSPSSFCLQWPWCRLEVADADLDGDIDLFASNTSTIPIARIAEGAERPERVVGMHFFSPVDRMPLLEVIPHAGTAPWVTNTAVAFGRRLGKTVIVVQDAPGFWVNRILGPYLNEAVQLVLSGVAIEEVDQLMVEFGFPVGPLTLLDEVGLDVAAKAAGVLYEAFGSRVAPAPGIKQMVDAGHLGRKSGSGFYTYRGGKRAGAHRAAYELLATTPNGGPRPAEVIQRLLYTMINEAARAVGEGVVHQARDGDVGALFGIGFPPFRGGPLRHADDLGASRLVLELERLTERCGPRFEPCEALREQARAGTKFYS